MGRLVFKTLLKRSSFPLTAPHPAGWREHRMIKEGCIQIFHQPKTKKRAFVGMNLKKFFTIVISLSALLYVGACAYLYFCQDQLIFHPKYDWKATPESIGLKYSEVSFQAQDGTHLSGWFVPSAPERAVILFCHGNSNNISFELGPLKVFHELGFSMFFFDYRGYGHSEGHPSEKGMAMDAEAALNYLLTEKKIPMERIIIQGRSLGGGVAIPLAVRYTPCALLVDSTFRSLRELAAAKYPIMPINLILRTRFENLHKISKLKCPVLITHSRQDRVIPFFHGLTLFEAAPEPKTFLEISGPHDNTGYPESQARYAKGVKDFLELYAPLRVNPV